MRIKMMYVAIMGTMIINSMETQKFVWQVHKIHHFGENADYDDFRLFGDPASDGFKLRLYGKKYGSKGMYVLKLFNEEQPIMQFDTKSFRNQTEYTSCDGNWRVIVARSAWNGYEYKGSEVISQYRRFDNSEEKQKSCKNICTYLAACMRSWCKKDKTT